MAKLTIEIGAKIDSLKRGIADARGSLNGFAKSVNQSMTGGVKIAMGIFGAGIAAALKHSVTLAASMEQTKVAFEVMTGSADKARGLIDSLVEFSTKTPFKQDEVIAASKTLLAFGNSAGSVIGILKILGDISSGTGKPIAELALIFGQIQSKGRLMAQDLNQLVEGGFNPLTTISKSTGRSMRDLYNDMEKGLISFDMVKQAFVDATSSGGQFFDLMEKQSQTLNGQLSTLSDSMDNIARGIGNTFLDEIKALTAGALDLAGALDDVAAARAKTQSGEVEASDPLGDVAANAAMNALAMSPLGLMLGPTGIIDKIRDQIQGAGNISTPAATPKQVAAGKEKADAARIEADVAAKDAADKAAKSARDAAEKDGEADWLDGTPLDRMRAESMRQGDVAKRNAERDAAIKKQAESEKAAAEFGVQGMQDAMESRRGELQANAEKLQADVGRYFTPGKIIQSSLARVGGEKTIQIDRQMPMKQLAELKNTVDMLKIIDQTIKDNQVAKWPG